MIPINQLEKIAITALEKAYQTHEKLGQDGEELVRKNQFGDTALKIDIEAEKAVMDTLREANLPIRIVSEEHGTLDLSKDPIYLGVLDGLDGTTEYKNNRGKGRYGTMLGIFSNLDPKYDDYLFGGLMEHSTKKLFFVSKGNGSFIVSNGERKPIHCSNCTELDKKTRIYADTVFDKNRNTTFIQDTFLSKLKGYNLLHEISMGIHLIDIATGDADLALHSTRKGNLEIASAYGLITEAGGVMVTKDGINVKNKKYLKFGQDRCIPIISASTEELAKKLIRHITY